MSQIKKNKGTLLYQLGGIRYHRLRTPREEIAITAWPKIQSQSQILWYAGSIFCVPHRPNFSDIFDLCLHWVSVVCGLAPYGAPACDWVSRFKENEVCTKYFES